MINLVEELLNALNEVRNMSIEGGFNTNFKESFENIKNIILKNTLTIQNNIENLSRTTEWNKLNVAFFGETNAGKSTIIEALTKGTGKSIGEGYKDFTLDVSIRNYQNINLIDMPGIEGKEYKVIKSIKEAVNKSHIIFYVIGTNKEPEETTIKKIKEFLKDNAKVYSIINVRGKPVVYKYKTNLVDNNITTIEQRVIEKFSKVLGQNYGGNFIINGYLALLANDNLENRFEKDKKKALDIFGNKLNIVKFSNIETIYNLLNNFEVNFKNEIIISNSYKFLKQINIMVSQILKEKKNFDRNLKETKEDVYKYLSKIENIFNKYKKEILTALEIHLSSLKNNLIKVVNEGIDGQHNETFIKNKIKNIQKQKEKELNKIIENLLSEMKEEICKTIEEFKDKISFKMKFFQFRGDFNIKEILEELSYSFGEIFKEILDTAMSIWGVIVAFAINPFLGAIAAMASLIRKIWDWFVGNSDKKKRKAKAKAIKQIEESIIEVKYEIKNKLEKNFKKLDKETKKPIKIFKDNLWKLKRISVKIDKYIEQIQITQVKISLFLIKNLLGEEVKFSYIDLQLSKAVIIGFNSNERVKKELIKLLRVKDPYMFFSYDEFFNTAGQFIKEQFKAKNEFFFRVVKALTLFDKTLNIKKVIK